MDIIEKLNNMEVGTPLVVIFSEDMSIRCVSLFAGKEGNIYNFVDIDHTYGLSEKYIKEGKVIIEFEINDDNELGEVVEIINKVKGVK